MSEPLTAEERVLRWATRYCSDMGAGPTPSEQADIDAVREKFGEAERLRAALREIAERARVGRYDITEIAESALAGTEAKP